jgi:hypothetical protein
MFSSNPEAWSSVAIPETDRAYREPAVEGPAIVEPEIYSDEAYQGSLENNLDLDNRDIENLNEQTQEQAILDLPAFQN